MAAAGGTPAWLVVVGSDGQVATAPLTEWHRLQQQADGGGGGSGKVYVAVADSSNQAAHPGWPLRNLLLLAAARWGQGMQSGTLCRCRRPCCERAGTGVVQGLALAPCCNSLCTLPIRDRWRCRQLHVLCLRERHGRYDAAASLALTVELPELPPGFAPAPVGGWEPNERGKLGVRTADLGPSMNPRRWAVRRTEGVIYCIGMHWQVHGQAGRSACCCLVRWEWVPIHCGNPRATLRATRFVLPACHEPFPVLHSRLAESAVELNLRLMRWRAVPSLDVGSIAGQAVAVGNEGRAGWMRVVPISGLSREPAHASTAALHACPNVTKAARPSPIPASRSRALPAAGCRHSGLLRGAHAAGLGRAAHHSCGQLAGGLQQPGKWATPWCGVVEQRWGAN